MHSECVKNIFHENRCVRESPILLYCDMFYGSSMSLNLWLRSLFQSKSYYQIAYCMTCDHCAIIPRAPRAPRAPCHDVVHRYYLTVQGSYLTKYHMYGAILRNNALHQPSIFIISYHKSHVMTKPPGFLGPFLLNDVDQVQVLSRVFSRAAPLLLTNPSFPYKLVYSCAV